MTRTRSPGVREGTRNRKSHDGVVSREGRENMKGVRKSEGKREGKEKRKMNECGECGEIYEEKKINCPYPAIPDMSNTIESLVS